MLFVMFISDLTYAQYDSVAHKLDSIHLNSIRLRKNVRPIIKQYGMSSPEMDSLNREIFVFDSTSFIYIKGLIDRYGWLGKSEVGVAGNQALFLTVQHSDDIDWLERAFPLLKKSALKGESSLYDAALLEDRLLVQRGELQKYGTQYYYDEDSNQYFFYPMEERCKVNHRRKKLGLEKIKKYAKSNDILFED